MQLLQDEIYKHPKNSFILLDGFPSSLERRIHLEEQIVPCKLALYLRCDEGTCISRALQRERTDDKLSLIHLRINMFNTNILPVIEYYRSKEMLIEVSTEGAIEENINQIAKLLGLS